MNTLNTSLLIGLSGGSLIGFFDGFCAGWTTAVLITGGAAAYNPVGAGISAGCAGYGIVRLFS